MLGCARRARRPPVPGHDRPGRPERAGADALADAEPVRAGEIIRIRTTGGGGWGDPLDRETERVLADVRDGKVSVDGARDDYGVVVTGSDDQVRVEQAGTAALRNEMRAARKARWPEGQIPFFDRGPGYLRLSGRTHSDLDLT